MKNGITNIIINIVIRIIISAIVVCLIEVLMSRYSIGSLIGTNPLTVATVTVLGIPGLLCLVGIGLVGKM